MKWTRISPLFGHVKCTTDGCENSARWQMVHVGSDYCSPCRGLIVDEELREAAKAVVEYDWSDIDADAVAAVERLRAALNG